MILDIKPLRDTFRERMKAIRRLLDVGDPITGAANASPIDREVRGLSVLLLFAAYENLITTLCRQLIDAAKSLNIPNGELKIGIRQFAVHSMFISMNASSQSKVWRETGRKAIECILNDTNCTLDSQIFPSDGSFMKKSQVLLFAEIFELGDPGAILKEAWVSLDAIVSQRNDIAHGKSTPAEIGRSYSSQDIRTLVDNWETRWIEYLQLVKMLANKRRFYKA
jgi:RiboL-PSP-HEPN